MPRTSEWARRGVRGRRYGSWIGNGLRPPRAETVSDPGSVPTPAIERTRTRAGRVETPGAASSHPSAVAPARPGPFAADTVPARGRGRGASREPHDRSSSPRPARLPAHRVAPRLPRARRLRRGRGWWGGRGRRGRLRRHDRGDDRPPRRGLGHARRARAQRCPRAGAAPAAAHAGVDRGRRGRHGRDRDAVRTRGHCGRVPRVVPRGTVRQPPARLADRRRRHRRLRPRRDRHRDRQPHRLRGRRERDLLGRARARTRCGSRRRTSPPRRR